MYLFNTCIYLYVYDPNSRVGGYRCVSKHSTQQGSYLLIIGIEKCGGHSDDVTNTLSLTHTPKKRSY